MQNDFSQNYEKIKYNGKSLELKANIGELIFTNKDGTEEFYKAEKILFHYPSEHLITLYSQTPRFPLEMQIVHKLLRSTNPDVTNSRINVEKAIVSIFFKEGSIFFLHIFFIFFLIFSLYFPSYFLKFFFINKKF